MRSEKLLMRNSLQKAEWAQIRSEPCARGAVPTVPAFIFTLEAFSHGSLTRTHEALENRTVRIKKKQYCPNQSNSSIRKRTQNIIEDLINIESISWKCTFLYIHAKLQRPPRSTWSPNEFTSSGFTIYNDKVSYHMCWNKHLKKPPSTRHLVDAN